MSKTKVVLNHKGFRQLLNSPEIYKAVEEAAWGVAQTAGHISGRDDGESEYNVSIKTGKRRIVAIVYPDTYMARKDNRENNTLLKALQR